MWRAVLPVLPPRLGYWLNMQVEKLRYRDLEVVHDLPDIYHYWSNKFLLPKFQRFGFDSPDDFFFQYSRQLITDYRESAVFRMLSIGAGNCDLEVALAKRLRESGFGNFVIECMDINPAMLDRGRIAALKANVADNIVGLRSDFNRWQPGHRYQIILANQSLHHVSNLEGLFDAVHQSLDDPGLFLVSDMIGRNGHQRWPEALVLVEQFWSMLTDQKKLNHLADRVEHEFVNRDRSSYGFEGIRAQEILILLNQYFNFHTFVPFANIIMAFIDREFGPNFSVENLEDCRLIDKIHARDEQGLLSGELKPTQMVAALSKQSVTPLVLDPRLTPDFCIRPTND